MCVPNSNMDLIVDFPQASPPNEKRVSFIDTTEINFVENLSHKHKDDLWYCGHEMNTFKFETDRVLRTLRANKMTMVQYAELHIQETHAFMGLESYMSATTAREIKYQRQKIRRSVFIEQHRQLRTGIYDPDAMAIVSQAASDWSCKRARIIALIHNPNERW